MNIFLRRWIGVFLAAKFIEPCYAPVLRVVRRGIYKNKTVWLQDVCAIPHTQKNLDIVRNFAKSCQHTIFWLFAYGAVLYSGWTIVHVTEIPPVRAKMPFEQPKQLAYKAGNRLIRFIRIVTNFFVTNANVHILWPVWESYWNQESFHMRNI